MGFFHAFNLHSQPFFIFIALIMIAYGEAHGVF